MLEFNKNITILSLGTALWGAHIGIQQLMMNKQMLEFNKNITISCRKMARLTMRLEWETLDFRGMGDF